ncbi:MAG: indolepyruvate ferredoxin oxidoreductase subunit alpha [Methanosarcinaceae archaeon]|nr:indolepyruvate ferredoxin oxidoreductase subunit alpha [Methanosarcinaceae archaeon]
MSTREYMLGNIAIARGIVEGGAQVISGYPGTPSSEIIDTLARMDERKFYVEWSVNEKVALEVAAGAAWSGVRSVVTMKHVGLNVAADPLMTLAYTGVKGGMIIIVADDPSCHSSQNEQDTRKYADFSLVPCLDPSTIQEAKDMIPYAFELSEKFEIPVIFRPTTRISHGKSDVEPGEVVENRPLAHFEKLIDRWVMLPKNARVRHSHLLGIQDSISKELEGSQWNELTISNGSEKIGIIASGIASVYTKEAIQNLGIDVSFLKISTYPVPQSLIKKMLEHADTILVIEELEPVVEDRVKIIANEVGLNTRIIGKTGDLVSRTGELNVELCKNAIANAFGIQGKFKTKSAMIATENIADSKMDVEGAIDIELPLRPPAMCPGCSHRAVYNAMKKVFGNDAVYPSDIGCYTLGVQSGTVETTLCMGSSITLASGIYHAGESRPICCSIGDSTFFHTGINGLMNAVYNKANITVTILDNRVTAMTGHQPNPGMGETATGEPTVEISIEKLCHGLGAEFVEVVDAYDRKATEDVFKRAKEYNGTSVVIAEQACVINARRMGIKHKPYVIDVGKCTGCKQCVKFGCPAIEFDAKGKHSKITALCTGCGVCAQICKFDAISEVGK